jgi:hypothetical protein
LRWNETLGVEEFLFSNRGITYRFLNIDVTDRHAIDRRQPRGKRVLALFANQRHYMGFSIPPPLLDRPAAALVTEIDHYINTHAPDGSWHKAVTEDSESKGPDIE